MKSFAIDVSRVAVLIGGAAAIGAAVAAAPAAASGLQSLSRIFGFVCMSGSPCEEWKNSGSGTAIQGDGTSGSGLVATSQKGTALFARSSSGVGVMGTSPTDNGVAGITANPSSVNGIARFGVSGTDRSTDGGTLDAGVFGSSTSGVGVSGASSSNAGVFGQTMGFGSPAAGVSGSAPQQQGNAAGVFGQSMGGPGVFGVSNSGGNPGVLAQNDGSGDGVDAFTATAVGVNIQTGGVSILGENLPGDGNPSAEFIGGTTSAGDVSLETFDGSMSATFWVGNDGNAHVRGLLYTGGPCSSGCLKTRGPAARQVERYVPQESLPTVEDMGEAQLVNGAAYVSIAADFANVIDPHSMYLVFVTPQGPTRGLYVANKTPQGFEVHEVSGGSASIAFDYRIVAKPYGVSARRLPMIGGARLPTARQASRASAARARL